MNPQREEASTPVEFSTDFQKGSSGRAGEDSAEKMKLHVFFW